MPARRGYVDAEGRPYELPDPGSGRAVTPLAHDGEPVAALVHDPALLDEPRCSKASAPRRGCRSRTPGSRPSCRRSSSRCSESRPRIVAAADDERRPDRARPPRRRPAAARRDSRSSCGSRSGGSAARRSGRRALLAASVDELQAAVGELRELARGVHPAVLTAGGARGGARGARGADAAPGHGRRAAGGCPRTVEAAAYFVACEALANVVKHAQASTASTIDAVREGGDARGRGRRRRRAAAPIPSGLGAPRARRPRRGARRPALGREPGRRRHARASGDPMRVVIADDSVLLREGLARLLDERRLRGRRAGGRRATTCCCKVRSYRPDVAIVDIRMPPTQTDEGAGPPSRSDAEPPEVGVLLLSQTSRPQLRARLLHRAAERLRLPAEGPRARRRRLPRRRAACRRGRHARSIPRSSRSSSAGAARTTRSPS